MNSIRSIQALNKRELEAGVTPSGSWHRDFADTAFIYVGGLPFTLSEGDLVTIFSQFGEPVFVNLVRDNDTGKSKGFAFLKYEDQRSTDLAVDNLGGATVMGRVLRVDHTRYKRKDDEDLADNTKEVQEERSSGKANPKDAGNQKPRSKTPEQRAPLKEELELAKLLRDHDDDDPMKDYLIQTKREEVAAALKALEANSKSRTSKHRRDDEKSIRAHAHRHRSHRDEVSDADQGRRSSRRHRSRERSPVVDSDSDRDRRHRRRRRDSTDARTLPRSRSRSPRRSRSPYRHHRDR